jgi:acyl-coenzyme A thioesterase PaaI-like protein
MDATELAQRLLDPIPAHRTLGLRVLRAADGAAMVATDTPSTLTNVVGSLHSSGLTTLVDAAGLAALIAACEDPDGFDGVVPLGSAADLRFLAPARGRLVASCRLSDDARAAVASLCAGASPRARTKTVAEIVDAEGVTVCRGTFDWSLRRLARIDGVRVSRSDGDQS